MKRVKVIYKGYYYYDFEDESGKKYRKDIDFRDVDINEGDYIYISEEVLNKKGIYTYGPIINTKNDLGDYIKVVKDNQEIYLERYFG